MPAPERDLTPEEMACLLTRHLQGDKTASDELLAAIDGYFRRHLRPLLVHWFREASGDTSARYSVMVNQFFTEVLDRRDDPFWRQKSLQAMRTYAATAIANDIRDLLRRRSKREPIGDDELLELAESRASHMLHKHGLDLATALDLDAWDHRPAPWPQRAMVLRLRYVIGMKYAEIEEQTGLPTSTAKDHHDRAIEALRAELGVSPRGGRP